MIIIFPFKIDSALKYTNELKLFSSVEENN